VRGVGGRWKQRCPRAASVGPPSLLFQGDGGMGRDHNPPPARPGYNHLPPMIGGGELWSLAEGDTSGRKLQKCTGADDVPVSLVVRGEGTLSPPGKADNPVEGQGGGRGAHLCVLATQGPACGGERGGRKYRRGGKETGSREGGKKNAEWSGFNRPAGSKQKASKNQTQASPPPPSGRRHPSPM